MTKADLAKALAESNNISQAKANEILDSLGRIVGTALAYNDEVTLPGIGKLEPVKTPERTARNPQTGAPVTVPARVKAKFKQAKALQDRLN